MSLKKNSTQKNTRHHFNTAPSIAKKQSAKAKLRNKDLQNKLDKSIGLAGAAELFSQPKKSHNKIKMEREEKKGTEKAMEEDILALVSMKLSTTRAH